MLVNEAHLFCNLSLPTVPCSCSLFPLFPSAGFFRVVVITALWCFGPFHAIVIRVVVFGLFGLFGLFGFGFMIVVVLFLFLFIIQNGNPVAPHAVIHDVNHPIVAHLPYDATTMHETVVPGSRKLGPSRLMRIVITDHASDVNIRLQRALPVLGATIIDMSMIDAAVIGIQSNRLLLRDGNRRNRRNSSQCSRTPVVLGPEISLHFSLFACKNHSMDFKYFLKPIQFFFICIDFPG